MRSMVTHHHAIIQQKIAGQNMSSPKEYLTLHQNATIAKLKNRELSHQGHKRTLKRSTSYALIYFIQYYFNELRQTLRFHFIRLQIQLNTFKFHKMAEPQSEQQKVPTTKEQLIEMLKDQLDKVEDEISSMQNTLEDQREKRKQLTSELEEKEQKITELIENESKTLGDKVSEGLVKTLQAANKMRADTDSEARRLAEDNSVLNEKILHRDNTGIEERAKIILNSKKLGSLEQKKIDCQRKEDNLKDKRQILEKDFNFMKHQHERIEKEEKQLRNHIENMKMLRLYLNKNLEGSLKNASTVKGQRGSVPDNFWNGP